MNVIQFPGGRPPPTDDNVGQQRHELSKALMAIADDYIALSDDASAVSNAAELTAVIKRAAESAAAFSAAWNDIVKTWGI